MPDLIVESWPLDRLRPYELNPRRNAKAIPKVAASLREFGFRQPIVVDEQGVIIVGHTRYAAAQSLGMATVPVHVARGLTPAQIAAYRIADNRTNEDSEWDWAKLSTELHTLRDADLDLAMTGFEAFELDPLLTATWEPPAVDADAPLGTETHSHGHAVTFTPEEYEQVMRAWHASGSETPVNEWLARLAADTLPGA